MMYAVKQDRKNFLMFVMRNGANIGHKKLVLVRE